MSDILKVADSLNAEVSRLNNERSKLEGMLESAKTNYEKAVKAYEIKYGVKLTPENIQSEYNDVFAKTKGAILDLQEKVESIKRGDYKNNAETVDFDMEPDVEPIREEVKKEPAKRGRKAKAKTKKEDAVENIEEKAAVIPDAEPEVKIAEGPLSFNMDFSATTGNSVSEVSETKLVSEAVEAKPTETKGKTLSAADLSAALKATDTSKQHPVEAVSEDEVDISSIKGVGVPFGVNPTESANVSEVKKETTPNVEIPTGFDFGGDFGFGLEPAKEVTEPTKQDTPTADFNFGGFDLEPAKETSSASKNEVKSDDEVDLTNFKFGGFEDASSFGSLSTGETTMKVPEEPKKEVGFGDFIDFGGFGGFSAEQLANETKVEAPKKTEPVKETPKKSDSATSGWGDMGKVDFDALLNNANFNFGV